MTEYDPTTQVLLPMTTKPTVWPKVVGILGGVFGITALINGALVLLVPNAAQIAYQEMQLSVPADFFERHWVAIKLLPSLGGLIGLLLLIGSILLILRKRVSRILLLTWAVAKLCFAFGQIPAMSALQQEVLPLRLQSMAQARPELKAAATADGNDIEAMIRTSSAVVVFWYCCFPVFCLVWLRRAKIREEVAGWGD